MTVKDRTSSPAELQWSAWMAAAQDGDASVYDRLLREILPMIRALVRRRLGASAAVEDVVQNVLLSVHRGRQTYRPERPFLPWLRAIARNAVTDAMRVERRRAEREVAIESLDAVLVASPPEPRGEELPAELVEAISELPDTQRAAVDLLYVQRIPAAEAALRLGISPGALRVRMHRALRTLRSHLEQAKRKP